MDTTSKKIKWNEITPLLATLLAIAFYGGLFLFIDIQDHGGFAAIFQDEERMITKILMALARFAR